MKIHPASFRDPAGYVFEQNNQIKRLVTSHGREDYKMLISSGLYDRLSSDQELIPHQEEPRSANWPEGTEAVLVPQLVPFISYPYEWSFGQLKDAALLTLHVQQTAMRHGMSLKDASAFNVQFHGSRPVLIDTLSFQKNLGGPWSAYSQFCRHFLGPLLLIRHLWTNAASFMRVALDGFPLDLVSSVLPKRTYLNFGCLIHIHLHARSQRKYERATTPTPNFTPSTDPKPALIESLRVLVESLQPNASKTEWSDYYAESTHYSAAAENAKHKAVSSALDSIKPNLIFDLGGNTGAYSRLATERGIYCVSFDLDPACVHLNYVRARDAGDSMLLPLVMDLSNPTPNLGFASTERLGLKSRAGDGMLLALAIIHHLRITANIPFLRIAEYFAGLGRSLLIEWVPKDDVKVAELLHSRPDTFHDYSEPAFAAAFQQFFDLERTTSLPDSGRVLYLFRSKRP
jgi:hypothetical protein